MNTSVINDALSKEEVYTFPTSFAQQRVWFLEQLEEGSAAYNIIAHLRLTVPIIQEILEQSIQAIVQRHEVLRTTIVAIEGEPRQLIAPELTIPLIKEDLQYLTETEREAAILRLATGEARQPFNIAEGPLLRLTLLELGINDFMLFLTAHHTIFDGWSIAVFFQELAAFYEAFLTGQPSPLPDLPVQYVDYAIWQQEWLQSKILDRHMDYWKQQLQGVPTLLELPTDHPRPPVQSYRGAIQPFVLQKGLSDDLKVLSRQDGVTLYMTLVTAFLILLHHYTGQDDIFIGSPFAGRTQAETENLIGFFISTLVLRTDISGNPLFRALLQRVCKLVLEADAHQHVPFEYLVRELQPERDLSQNPLFQVILTLEPQIRDLPAGWIPVHMPINTGTSKFDLTVEVYDMPEGLSGFFEYNTDLFNAVTIERMVEHWQILLESIAHDPDRRIADLPIMTPQEKQELHEWNMTVADYPRNTCVHRLFEEQAERVPDNIALIFEDQHMTYRELNTRANRLAHCLRRLGVGTETLVGVCMDRSFELIVSLLGILKAGGAYVPLDPAYPKERLAFMLQDTQTPVLLTQSRLADALPDTEAHIVCLDASWKTIDQECAENLDNRATAENLAYVMYTSGSTGRPKGTEIRHFSINRLVFAAQYAQLDASQTILHMASISFDAATLEVWGALLHGARCVIFPERVPTPKSIGALARKHSVTLAWLTASLFNAVIDEAPQALAGISHVLTGGEALSVPHVRRALQELPSTRLTNGYGPTESTTFTTCYSIPRHLGKTLRSIPIGKPIGNTQVHILDKYLRRVPIGIAGELYIGGDGLARGYFYRPELTAERFIDDPFSEKPGAKLYKTGDIARYLPDGNIEFVGRRDLQVKIRGFRVEPGEVEVLLCQYAAVREALVIVKDNARGEKCLVAYIVPQEGQRITISTVRNFLKEHLPDYMIPSDFVLLDALPLTPNGKLDHHALPEPDPLEHPGEDNFVAPTQIIHYQLLALWEDLLQVRPIGIQDNFFDLGGHSLLAARLVTRIEEVCGKKLSIATLFAGPTIEQLAKALQSEIAHQKAPVAMVQAGGSKRPFFFLHGDTTGGAFYCFPLARQIGPDQPFYALESYQFDNRHSPLSLQEIATAQIRALRSVQSEGPYLLGGFCNGSLIAYEMARQLQIQGQRVDLLVLIEPIEFSRFHWIHKNISHIAKLFHLNKKRRLDIFLHMQHLYRYLLRRSVFHTSEYLKAYTQLLATPFPPTELLYKDFSAVLAWLNSEYELLPYSGKIAIFWAKEEQFQGVWKRKVEQEKIEFHLIPGDHITCRTDYLSDLASELGRCIDKAQNEYRADNILEANML